MILRCEEEKELVQFVSHCASVGYSKTRGEVLAIVECVLSSRETEKAVTNGWWKGFYQTTPLSYLLNICAFISSKSYIIRP